MNSQIKHNINSGQIALIMLVVMATVLASGLSLSKRTASDISLTDIQEESAKAFSAAESGVEEALKKISENQNSAALSGSDFGVDNIDITINSAGSGTSYLYPLAVNPGEVMVFWLRDHNSDGTLKETSGYVGSDITLCWNGGSSGAAIEAIYFYNLSSQYRTAIFSFDSETSRADSNGFTIASGPGCNGLTVSADISLVGTPLFIVIKPFYNQTKLGIVASSNLPSQGFEIESSGSINRDTEKSINRKIKVFRGYSFLPPYFLSTLFSGNNINGN